MLYKLFAPSSSSAPPSSALEAKHLSKLLLLLAFGAFFGHPLLHCLVDVRYIQQTSEEGSISVTEVLPEGKFAKFAYGLSQRGTEV